MKIEDLDPLTRTLHATASSVGCKIDPDVLEAVRAILKKRDAANAHLTTLGRDRISAIYDEQMRHGVATIGKGEPAVPCKRGPYQTKAQIGDSLQAERQAVKRGLEDLHRQLSALIRPEAVRFTEDALEMISALEESEQGVADDFSIPYVPSHTLTKLRQAISTVLDRNEICWQFV